MANRSIDSLAQNASFRFSPMEPRTLKQRISLRIRSAILEGHLPPGTRIVEATLAAEMGVAQSSIREGMMELVNQGFLVKYVNRETVVRKLNAGDIGSLFRVRTELEGLAAELVHRNLTNNSLDPLQALVQEMHEAARSGDLATFYQYDIEFHLGLWRLTGNEFLERCLIPISIAPVAFFLAGSPLAPEERDYQRVAEGHHEILLSLQTGPGSACRKLMTAKIREWRDSQRLDALHQKRQIARR